MLFDSRIASECRLPISGSRPDKRFPFDNRVWSSGWPRSSCWTTVPYGVIARECSTLAASNISCRFRTPSLVSKRPAFCSSRSASQTPLFVPHLTRADFTSEGASASDGAEVGRCWALRLEELLEARSDIAARSDPAARQSRSTCNRQSVGRHALEPEIQTENRQVTKRQPHRTEKHQSLCSRMRRGGI